MCYSTHRKLGFYLNKLLLLVISYYVLRKLIFWCVSKSKHFQELSTWHFVKTYTDLFFLKILIKRVVFCKTGPLINPLHQFEEITRQNLKPKVTFFSSDEIYRILKRFAMINKMIRNTRACTPPYYQQDIAILLHFLNLTISTSFWKNFHSFSLHLYLALSSICIKIPAPLGSKNGLTLK